MQVFAGQAAFQPTHVDASAERIAQQQFDSLWNHDLASLPAADVSDENPDADDEDSSSHADVGDDIIVMLMPAFVGEASIFVPVLCRDDAHPSPFLPPAGRPPRA